MRKSLFNTDHLKKDVKGRSVRGGAVTILGQSTRIAINTVSTIVLARLLVPADFGLIAMVTAITGFAAIFKDLGLSMATIQRAEITPEQVSTLFWVNVGFSVLVAGIIASLAPLVAWFYSEPRLIMITVALSSVFLFGGLTVQHEALLKRQMQFATLAGMEVVSIATGVSVAIASAALGAGYWSLVLMHAASACARAIGVWVLCDWRPGGLGRGVGAKDLLVFGANITGFRVVNYFSRTADNILIGWYWGAVSLGFYGKAYALLMLPINQINMPLSAVAIPALSRLQSDLAKYRSFYLKVIFLITFVSTPIVAFFIVCCENLILVILGPQWTPASDIFFALGFSALIQPLYFTQGWLHVSSGRSDRFLRWGLFSSPVIVLAFVAGLPHGAVGVAVAYSVATWAIILPGMWYAGKSAGITLKEIVGGVYKNILAGLGSIGFSAVVLQHVLLLGGKWENLSVGLSCVLLSYGLCIIILYRNLSPWRKVSEVCRTLFRKNTG